MVARLQFPLEDQDKYGARVSFQAFKIIPPSVGISGTEPTVDAAATETNDVALSNKVINLFNSTSSNMLKVPLDSVSLYLPQAVSFSDGVDFEDFELGRIGATVEAGLNNGGNLFGETAKGAASALSSLTDIISASATRDAAALAATKVSKIGGQGVAGGVKSALRVTSNPNKRVLFKEVRIREFTFQFKLIPNSKNEAEEITNIVRFFRENLYPEDFGIDTPGGTYIPIGYKFPNQFNITLSHRERELGHKILPSYLVSMQTNYNPSSMGFFEDGNFTETDISLTFREFRALNKRDIVEGGF